MNKVFIFGAPRSGTTLLRLLLTNHPKVHIPAESPFLMLLIRRYLFRPYFKKISDKRILEDLSNLGGRSIIQRWGVDADAIADLKNVISGKTFADSIEEIYKLSIDENSDEITYWGDKNNSYQLYAGVLLKLFPDAKFIHIVRDPRAIYNSFKKLSLKGLDNEFAPKIPKSAESFALDWYGRMKAMERFKDNCPNLLELRYEDLVMNLDSTLEIICTFLDLPVSDRMASFYRNKEGIVLEPKGFYKWKDETENPVHEKSISEWKYSLSEQESYAIESTTYPYLSDHYNSTGLKLEGRSLRLRSMLFRKHVELYFRRLVYFFFIKK